MVVLRFAVPMLWAVQLLGMALAIWLIGVSYLQPLHLAHHLQGPVLDRVETTTRAALTALTTDPDAAPSAAMAMLTAHSELGPAAALNRRNALVAAVIGHTLGDTACGPACQPYATAAKAQDPAQLDQFATLALGPAHLGEVVDRAYAQEMAAAVTDLRLFGLVNVVVMGLMLFALKARHWGDGWHMIALSMVLTGILLWAARAYILPPGASGPLYFHGLSGHIQLFAMTALAFVLIDWLFLRGRITKTVRDLMLEAVVGN